MTAEQNLLLELKDLLKDLTVNYMEDDAERFSAIAKINETLGLPQDSHFCGCKIN